MQLIVDSRMRTVKSQKSWSGSYLGCNCASVPSFRLCEIFYYWNFLFYYRFIQLSSFPSIVFVSSFLLKLVRPGSFLLYKRLLKVPVLSYCWNFFSVSCTAIFHRSNSLLSFLLTFKFSFTPSGIRFLFSPNCFFSLLVSSSWSFLDTLARFLLNYYNLPWCSLLVFLY